MSLKISGTGLSNLNISTSTQMGVFFATGSGVSITNNGLTSISTSGWCISPIIVEIPSTGFTYIEFDVSETTDAQLFGIYTSNSVLPGYFLGETNALAPDGVSAGWNCNSNGSTFEFINSFNFNSSFPASVGIAVNQVAGRINWFIDGVIVDTTASFTPGTSGLYFAIGSNSSYGPVTVKTLDQATIPPGYTYINQPVPAELPYVTDGLVFMLDPRKYAGGQTWGDNPSYLFGLGNSTPITTGDPTFRALNWQLSNSYFTNLSTATSFINNMHKAGSTFTIEAFWYRASDGQNVNPIFDSGTSDQSGSDVSRGIVFADQGSQAGPAGRWGLRVLQSSGGASALNAYLLTPPAMNAWHHHAVSYTGTTGSFLWLDGNIAPSNLGSTTWNGTLTNPSTLDPVNPARVGARGDAAFSTQGNLGILRIYNRALSSAELLQNWNADRSYYNL